MSMRAVLSGMLCTSLALGPAITPAVRADQAGIVLHSGGIEALIVDQKDAGLRRALDLVERRLVELPRELRGNDFPTPVAQALWQLIANPVTLRVNPFEAPNPDVLPVSVMLTARGHPQRGAESLLQYVNTFVPVSGLKFSASDASGISTADSPVGKFFIGTHEIDAGPRFVAALNDIDTNPEPIGLMGLPEGVTPALAVHADLGKFKPVYDRFVKEAGDDPAENAAETWLKSFGLGTDHTLTFDAAIGHAADRAAVRAVWRNQALNTPGDPSRSRIKLDLLKLIPADAIAVTAGTFDLAAMIDELVEGFEGEAVADPFAELNAELGMNVRTDLIDALGTTYAFYRSDNTGGGGLLSMVAIAELAKPDVFASTHAKIRKLVEEKLAPEADGYVRIRSWKHADRELFSWSFPGLPIPVEPSWTIHNNVLILGATPNALLAAIQNADNPGPGILTNPEIARLLGDKSSSLAAVSYLHSPRLAREGYTFVSLVTSALANAVRSPTSPARDPGVVMPMYADFIKDVRPLVTVTTWQGDDLVLQGEMDRSMLVNAAAAAGGFGGPTMLAIVPLGVGVLLPALSKARATAEQVKSATQVRAIGQAAIVYCQNNNSRPPKSMQELVDAGLLTPEILQRPSNSSNDGSPDYAIRTTLNVFNSFDSSVIVVIERAAIVNGESRLNVAFADGHVNFLSVDDFWKQMGEKQNAGAAADFAIEQYAPDPVEP